MNLQDVLTKIDHDLPQATERLLALLRIPSISTDPSYKDACESAADWLVADLLSMGVTAEKRATPGHPMVVGHIGDGAPHVLFYGHYDVQPVDPVELWDSDPFDPQLQDTQGGRVIRGRGSSDDKGQLMTFIEACRAWQSVHGSLPCRITFFFEGEEESGSPSLVPFLQENKAELSADLALICDTGLFESRIPAIVTMLRGNLCEEIVITAPIRTCIRACLEASQSIRFVCCLASCQGCMMIVAASPFPSFTPMSRPAREFAQPMGWAGFRSRSFFGRCRSVASRRRARKKLHLK